MRVAISGASGLIGRTLADALRADGHTVLRMVRDRASAGPDDIFWSVAQREIDRDALATADAVVHLAGEPIGARRWTDEQKARIRDSRVVGTDLIATAMAEVTGGPQVLLSGSAVGFYGDRGDEVLTEDSASGEGFLASVTRQWEEAATPARAAGIRVVHPRTGVVIAEDGPLIEKVRLPFRLGIGGRVGSGRQWVPWISLDDEVAALRFLLDHDLEGPVNVTGPESVRNTELTKALGTVMRRPTVMPVPVFALRLLYGEMGVTLATDSTRVRPERLTEAGFTWSHTDLLSALRAALG